MTPKMSLSISVSSSYAMYSCGCIFSEVTLCTHPNGGHQGNLAVKIYATNALFCCKKVGSKANNSH